MRHNTSCILFLIIIYETIIKHQEFVRVPIHFVNYIIPISPKIQKIRNNPLFGYSGKHIISLY
jgi:hypothetical protein